MAYDLRDRVVFITGASTGIGRACAHAFHQAGARVAAAARSLGKLKELAREIGSERILPVRLDVTVPEQREQSLRKVRDLFGPIDVLVNNAGWASFGTVRRMPGDDVRRMLEINLEAPVALTQAVLPEMLERGSGQIINISSVVGTQAMPRMAVYSATKAALNAFSTALRMELKKSPVDVIVVAPGSTNTPFFSVASTNDTQVVRLAETQYTAERVARSVVVASRKRRRHVTLSAEGQLICWIRRISPRVADAIIYRVSLRFMPEKKE
jgi:hypothetical protein